MGLFLVTREQRARSYVTWAVRSCNLGWAGVWVDVGKRPAMHEPCRPWDRAGDPSGGRACVQKYITKIILLDNNKCSMLALIPVRNTSSFLKLDINDTYRKWKRKMSN